MDNNLLLKATRNKFRYPSVRGGLSTEQLWDLPLISKNQFDLNSVAKAINTLLKAETEESFVEPVTNSRAQELTEMLEVVKQVITIKRDERDQAEKAAARKQERQRLLEILDQKNEAAMMELSREEIQKRIQELSD